MKDSELRTRAKDFALKIISVCDAISASMLLSCAIISSDVLLSAALMQDKLTKANKIIVATITLCLMKIPPIV